ncbi:MFS general substrate transporter [Dentipellis sp. KUC8613]|nr:MFS general substrate transporter [Dentipellis sp. KUC8613]
MPDPQPSSSSNDTNANAMPALDVQSLEGEKTDKEKATADEDTAHRGHRSVEVVSDHGSEHTASSTMTSARQGAPDATDSHDKEEDEEVIIVDWDGPEDPANPKNWTIHEKWIATAFASSFTFISPISSSMVAPAADQIASEFGIHSTVVIAMVTSIFVCAYAIGPLLWGPLSEIHGRSPVLQLTNVWFFAWNLGCGFAQNTGQLIAFRFLSGLGGSAALSIGGGVLADVWHPAQRGQALAIYALAPLLGPVVGPVAGAWIAQDSTWRWVFWSTTVVDACIGIVGFLYLRESFAPVLLERKAALIRASNSDKPNLVVRTIYSNQDRHWKTILKNALIRPLRLFALEPIVQLMGSYLAFVYGLLYLFITTLPAIFQSTYHQRVGPSGLHYIALGLGLGVGAQLGARLLDRSFVYFSSKNGGVAKPEYRLPPMIPTTLLLPAGLLITGWTAQEHVFWLVPDIGISLVGASVILTNLCLQSFIIDTFTLYAASALAATTFLRSLAGFAFPLFAPALFAALGYGKGDTVLAACALAAAPVCVSFCFYSVLRSSSFPFVVFLPPSLVVLPFLLVLRRVPFLFPPFCCPIPRSSSSSSFLPLSLSHQSISHPVPSSHPPTTDADADADMPNSAARSSSGTTASASAG